MAAICGEIDAGAVLFEISRLSRRLLPKLSNVKAELVETPNSLNSINVYTVRIVEANKNETLEELGNRNNNVVNTSITAVMNGIEEDAKLQKKQVVKIVISEKYFK